MVETALEKRVSALEQQVADLAQKVHMRAVKKDWRSTLGMFAGDALMKEIDAEGRKIREADREQVARDHS